MEDVKHSNFIEEIIEEDLKKGTVLNHQLRFRFPPEPNGFLHIGHAKSICLNFGLGKRYNAPVNLRFDDTNPNNEEEKYVEAIKEDVVWLGYKWDKICYASDYFDQLYQWAIMLIKKGKAYIDSQSAQDIALQKGTPTESGKESPFRNRSVDENLTLFDNMKNGKYKEGEHVLRAKIDMTSSNMLMRDPLMYRIIEKLHLRTGNQWCIYPMYDWTHGESDYLEQVSHSLCTLEFAMHREVYEWFINHIHDQSKIKPKQWEFARLNLSFTVMSKRKLLLLVKNKLVDDWDDPRLPTLSGLRRRGYTAESIIRFCETIGVAKRDNLIDISLLEFHVREHLNRTVPRVMAVLNPLKLVITNYPDEKTEWLKAENFPEEATISHREMPFSKVIYIEQEDFREIANRKFFRLKLGSEVRLKNAYIIKAEKVIKDEAENIIEVHCTYDPKSKSGSNTPESLRKIKGTLHWVSKKHAIQATINIYDRLFNVPQPDLEDDFLTAFNKDSLTVQKGYLESSLAAVKPGDRYQFQRLGYFCVDKNSQKENLIFNKIVSLKDRWGRQDKKEESLSSSKKI